MIGWMASVLDDVATETGEQLLSRGVVGADGGGSGAGRGAAGGAQRCARRAATRPGRCRCCMPGQRRRGCSTPGAREPSSRPSLVLQALPGMLGGYTRAFHRAAARVYSSCCPGLRAGELQVEVLTGLGGAGKSTLATRLARKLEADGWMPLWRCRAVPRRR